MTHLSGIARIDLAVDGKHTFTSTSGVVAASSEPVTYAAMLSALRHVHIETLRRIEEDQAGRVTSVAGTLTFPDDDGEGGMDGEDAEGDEPVNKEARTSDA